MPIAPGRRPFLCKGIALLFLVFPCAARLALSSEIKIEHSDAGFRLMRDGVPFFVKGAGGEEHLDVLAKIGGNSIRTWSTEHLGYELEAAQKNGLTVCAGICLAPERHGFNYSDAARVAEQLERVKRDVAKYKAHPALLLWGVGNEIEGDGTRESVWRALDSAAQAIHELDPQHPTMAVLAEINPVKIKALGALCPNIDILGINCYGGAHNVAKRVRESGWTKPFIVTEYGPLGFWEAGRAKWGAPLEETSSQKADRYLINYQRSIAPGGQCLGSYAFVWGHKQERTATWFGMFLKSGESLGSVDALSYAFTGRFPANRAPRILELDCDVHNKEVEPGTAFFASITASDDDGDKLSAKWSVVEESRDLKIGGDTETDPVAHPEALIETQGLRATFKAPATPGPYRLFATVLDGKGHAATANAVFLVKKK